MPKENADEQVLIHLVTEYVASYRSLPPLCAKIIGVLFVKAGGKGLRTADIAGLVSSKFTTVSNNINLLRRLDYVKVLLVRNQGQYYSLNHISFFRSYHFERLTNELSLVRALFAYQGRCKDLTVFWEVRCIEIYEQALVQCKALVENMD